MALKPLHLEKTNGKIPEMYKDVLDKDTLIALGNFKLRYSYVMTHTIWLIYMTHTSWHNQVYNNTCWHMKLNYNSIVAIFQGLLGQNDQVSISQKF